MNKNTVRTILLLFCIYSSNVNAQDYLQILDSYFTKLVNNKELTSKDLQWDITSEHISSISNIHHIYFSQQLNGIEIANTESSLHLSSDNKIVSSSNRFIKKASSKLVSGIKPSLSAKEVVNAIAEQMSYSITVPIKYIEESKVVNQKTTLTNGGISKQDITLELKYFQNKQGSVVLAWKVNLYESEGLHLWDFYVDANTGVILNKVENYFSCIEESATIQPTVTNYNSNLFDMPNYKKPSNKNVLECENCYEVIPYPYENAYETERVTIQNPSNPIASPYGWHNISGSSYPDFLSLIGNNITAKFFDTNYSSDGGQFLNFTDFPFDENYSEENNFIDASLTNVFYWGNLMHDIIYLYGFNESAGNFQRKNLINDNYRENDHIIIQGQDEEENCNAGISMGPDGFTPRMKLGTCDNKDSSFDNLVVLHEYAHGISYRLIGGAMSTNCLNGDERMDEGYSDWYGLLFTMKQGDQGEDARGYAPYFFNQGANGTGLRPYPYSTDMNVNPFVYDYIQPEDSSINWIWASILWDLTWNLIDQNGFDENLYSFTGDVNQDAGNIMALAIVTESMKFVGCSPTLVETRNAIIGANNAIYGRKYECILWDAFAKRGLGVYAFKGGPASYETPPLTASFTVSQSLVCQNSSLIEGLSGGYPEGGVYSGYGVIDDGNGRTFSFNPEITGLGLHTVNYEVLDSFCSIASTTTDIINVEFDETPPTFSCPENINVQISVDESAYSLISFSAVVAATDNCSSNINYTQTPAEGTLFTEGEYVINLELSDDNNNIATCSFSLIVEKQVNFGDRYIKIYPNPTNSDIVIYSLLDLNNVTIELFDINGRLVKNFNFSNFGFERNISIEELSPGMYFFNFKSNQESFTARILKE